MKRWLLLLLLLTAAALAEFAKTPEGARFEVPSSFGRGHTSSSGTQTWTHPANRWTIKIQTASGGYGADYYRTYVTGPREKATSVTNITVPGAEDAIRAEWSEPGKVRIYAWANKVRYELELDNPSDKSPEGFQSVVDRVVPSFKLEAPTASSTGSGGDSVGELGLTQRELKAKFQNPPGYSDQYTDGVFIFSVEKWDGQRRSSMVRYLRHPDNSSLAEKESAEIRKRYGGTFTKSKASDRTNRFWINKGKKLIMSAYLRDANPKDTTINVYTFDGWRQWRQDGYGRELPEVP